MYLSLLSFKIKLKNKSVFYVIITCSFLYIPLRIIYENDTSTLLTYFFESYVVYRH